MVDTERTKRAHERFISAKNNLRTKIRKSKIDYFLRKLQSQILQFSGRQ